jgi:hypothetical protein
VLKNFFFKNKKRLTIFEKIFYFFVGNKNRAQNYSYYVGQHARAKWRYRKFKDPWIAKNRNTVFKRVYGFFKDIFRV